MTGPGTQQAIRRTDEASGGASGVRHLAIVLDGNGRRARQRGLPRAAGHKAGVEAVRAAVRNAAARGIAYLTLFAFSTENWSRPAEEVGELMRLLRLFIRSDLEQLHRQNVRIRILGDRGGLDPDLRALLEGAEAQTLANTGLGLQVAFNYGGRQEIARAARRLAERAAAGELDPAGITAEQLAGELDTAGLPDPDLILRTSGEQRLSNFLLWQAAYSEFVFLPLLWPDFDDSALETALREFAGRERRYGGLG